MIELELLANAAPETAGALEVFAIFVRFGLLSFGGALGIVPEIEREIVLQRGWLEPRVFTDGYALAQFSPGPNMLAVAFYGFKIAGLAGGIGAFLGMFTPAAILTAGFARAWGLLGDAPWPKAVRDALLPIGLGLAAGGTLTLARGAIHSWFALALAALSLALVSGTRLNPVFAILVCGAMAALFAAFGIA
jgi:chromate transporter